MRKNQTKARNWIIKRGLVPVLALSLKYNNSLENITSDNSSNLNLEAGEINDEGNLCMLEGNNTTVKGETQNKTAVTNSKDKDNAMPELASINVILTLF
jgi:hypothetical protein